MKNIYAVLFSLIFAACAMASDDKAWIEVLSGDNYSVDIELASYPYTNFVYTNSSLLGLPAQHVYTNDAGIPLERTEDQKAIVDLGLTNIWYNTTTDVWVVNADVQTNLFGANLNNYIASGDSASPVGGNIDAEFDVDSVYEQTDPDVLKLDLGLNGFIVREGYYGWYELMIRCHGVLNPTGTSEMSTKAYIKRLSDGEEVLEWKLHFKSGSGDVLEQESSSVAHIWVDATNDVQFQARFTNNLAGGTGSLQLKECSMRLLRRSDAEGIDILEAALKNL